jgi:FkbM family methyltransferase
MIDGGANIGLVSILASRWVGERGEVIAFEPAPEAAAMFRQNLRLNSISNVRLVEAALGDRNGRMDLIVDMDVSNQLVLETPEGRITRSVPLVRLSDAVAGGPFALAKLDLEGAELAALLGAERLLVEDELPVILIEALENQLRRLGGSRAQVFELLEDHGYHFAEYEADSNRLTLKPRPGDRDFFAIRTGHEELVRHRLADY